MTYVDAMKLIKHTEAPVFSAASTTVTGYAAPSRGASELSLWQIELEPGSTSPLHYMDCEEVFLGLSGHAVAAIDETEHQLGPGDCLILPAGTAFTLHVPGEEPFRAMACIAVGGQATMVPDGPTFAPPWAT
jgi:mannose-6-phosphate isomerase-like protein (cupin superfamily)